MSNPSESSTHSSRISDFWAQTQSQGDDPAGSPFAPKRPRLVPGGPPLELSNGSTPDRPGFFAGRKRANGEPIERDDIERIEESLRRLKRRQPPNVDRSYAEPGPLPWVRPESAEPAAKGGILDIVPNLFSIVFACLIAGVITVSAAYLGATNGQAQHRTANGPTLAAVEPEATIVSPALARQARPGEYQTAASGAWVPPIGEITSGEAMPLGRAAASMPRVANDETVMLASRSEAQPERPAPPPRRLDPAYVQLLAEHGRQFVAAGDVAAARVVLERAARAGDPGAALALGGTYDPAVLKQIGALGIAADPEKARTWYEKAREFGSLEAVRRLDLLASR